MNLQNPFILFTNSHLASTKHQITSTSPTTAAVGTIEIWVSGIVLVATYAAAQ